MTLELAGQRRKGSARLRSILGRVTDFEWLPVAASAPLLIFPTVRPRFTVVALGGLIILWLIRWLVRGEPWPVTPFNAALLLFALMIPIAVWASAVPELTLPKVTGLVLGLTVFRVVAFSVQDRRTLPLALAAFSLVGLGITAVGVLGAGWLDKVAPLSAATRRIPRLITHLPGAPARGVHPNQLAGALVLYLPLAIALMAQWFLHRDRGTGALLRRLASLSLVAVFGAVLVLTQSRSGWVGGLAALVALASLWGLSHRQRWARILGVLLPALLVLVAVAGVLYIGPQTVAETLYQAGTGAQVEGVVGEMTVAGRIEIWNRALYAIQDFPFTGCGLGTFRRVVHVLYPLFLVAPDMDIAHAHNIFFQTALDLGLPGLVAYFAILLVALALCWKWARRGHPLLRPVALGLGAGLVGLHVYGLGDALALGSKPGVAFWFALGLIAALDRVGPQSIACPPPAKPETPFFDWISHRPWLIVAVAAATLSIIGSIYWAVRSTGPAAPSPAEPSIRLPLYPAAQGADVRTEDPPSDAGWAGPLEVATFTTTHPITDVVTFYTDALTDAAWHTDIEAGDAESWGGIYIKNDGHAVCMLNAFSIEGERWVSIVCGDKAEPVDLPSFSPLPTPTVAPGGGND